MKKQKKPHGNNSRILSTVILDEFHMFAPAGGAMSGVLAMGQAMRKPGSRRAIATQAVMKFNSGKRLRFLGFSRWEDTGELVKLVPKKFLPAQVLRRQTTLS